MAGLVDSIVVIIEFLILGSLTAFVIAYLAVFCHAVVPHAKDYFVTIWTSVWGKKETSSTVQFILIGLCLSALYFLGVVSNVANYWFLTPVHNRLIYEARCEYRGFTHAQSDITFLWNSLWSVTWRKQSGWENEDDDGRYDRAYKAYIRSETDWRNSNLNSAKDILPVLLKFIRIIRGVVVLGLLTMILAAVKCLVDTLALLLLRRSRRRLMKTAKSLYYHLIDWEAYSRSARYVRPRVRLAITKRILGINSLFCLSGLAAFVIALLSYRTIEREYMLMVFYGAGF